MTSLFDSIHFLLDEKSSATSHNPTTGTRLFSAKSVNSTKFIVSTENTYATSSNAFRTPEIISSNNSFSLNLQISTIGGIIALLLLALTTKSFLKLYLKRKERAHQMSVKTESVQEEDFYQELNDEVNETNEHLHHRNYHQLKHGDSVTNKSNKNKENYMHYQQIDEKCDASNMSDLSSINLLANKSEQHSYLEVLDSDAPYETPFIDGSISVISQNNQDPTSQYLDAVHNEESSTRGIKSDNSEFVDGDAYLDVTNENMQ